MAGMFANETFTHSILAELRSFEYVQRPQSFSPVTAIIPLELTFALLLAMAFRYLAQMEVMNSSSPVYKK